MFSKKLLTDGLTNRRADKTIDKDLIKIAHSKH